MREGWELKKIEDIGILSSGNSINAKVKEDKYLGFTGGIPYIATKDISYDRHINYDNGIRISDYSNFRIAKRNSVLICAEGGSAGRKIGITNQDICFVNKLFSLETSKSVLGKFVFFWYQTECFQNSFKGSLTGIIGGVSKKKFQMLKIPIPPIQEQKQIIAILDQSFAAIDQAKTNIEKNIENAKELMLSARNRIFIKLQNESLNVELPYVCDDIFAGGDVPKNNYSKEKTDKYVIPIIANAVKNNGLYGFTDRARVKKPSLTIAARGSGTGHTEIRIEPFFPIVRLIVLTPNSDKVLLEFLKYSILNLDILRSGSAIPQLTIPMIKKYSVPLPDLYRQGEIVAILNSIDNEIDNYVIKKQRELSIIEDLKKSILQKAFSGELTNKENGLT
jgi:type I restriction enzyme S subunit